MSQLSDVDVDRATGRYARRFTSRDVGGAALFLDRDGVLIVDHGYVGQTERTELIGDALDAVAEAFHEGVPIVVVTNQAGIARGYYDWTGFESVNELIRDGLTERGADIDMLLACSAKGGSGHPWRKPRAGMLRFSAEELHLDLASSWLVGDRVSDIDAAHAAGLGGALLVGDATGVQRDHPAAGIRQALAQLRAYR